MIRCRNGRGQAVNAIKRYVDAAHADKSWATILFRDVDAGGGAYAVTPLNRDVDVMTHSDVIAGTCM